MVTRAKKSIAAFKLRAGMPIGAMVTLRGERMYSFLDRLMNVALPRQRDFRGVPRDGFDGRGNYSLGLTDQLIFPELNYDDVFVPDADVVGRLRGGWALNKQTLNLSRLPVAAMAVGFAQAACDDHAEHEQAAQQERGHPRQAAHGLHVVEHQLQHRHGGDDQRRDLADQTVTDGE